MYAVLQGGNNADLVQAWHVSLACAMILGAGKCGIGVKIMPVNVHNAVRFPGLHNAIFPVVRRHIVEKMLMITKIEKKESLLNDINLEKDRLINLNFMKIL